ncbi:hypothetical protein GCM10027521_63550 [Amycolatopsis cihanbeyliensis]
MAGWTISLPQPSASASSGHAVADTKTATTTGVTQLRRNVILASNRVRKKGTLLPAVRLGRFVWSRDNTKKTESRPLKPAS